MKHFNKWLVIIFLLAPVIKVLAQKTDKEIAANAKIEAFVRQKMEEKHIPGLSLAVMQEGKLIFAKAYGYSNLEHRVSATTTTPYGIASITKSLTAMAIMILVEKEKLSLEDEVGTYFQDLPGSWKNVTIRQLLSHTSGISSFSEHEKIPCDVGKDVRDYVRGDALKEVACLPLMFAPGERWSYGDTSYYLLGMLIERISDMSYEQFLAKHIFYPLGMHNTRLMSYKDLIPDRAEGYAHKDGSYLLAPRFEIDEFANGGIVSSVMDMIKLHHAFRSEDILKKQTWALMWTGAKLNNGETVPYGLGFGLTPFEGKLRIGHNGGGGLGFSTGLTHFPEQNLTVVVLSNADQPAGFIGTFVNTVASFYFK